MSAQHDFQLEEFDSPVGKILLVSGGGAVRALDFGGYEARLHKLLAAHWGAPALHAGSSPTDYRRRVNDYFAGDLQALDALAVETAGTVFQRLVWQALRRIPAGSTWTYGQLAAHIDRPRAVRAAGHANSLNPVGIIVPCHRVIGANASLTGYAGGLERKHWLLRHEGVTVQNER